MLDKLLSNPILDGVTVRFTLRKPFAVLVQMNENVDWCARGDLNPYTFRLWLLRPACLPIPPPAQSIGHYFVNLTYYDFNMQVNQCAAGLWSQQLKLFINAQALPINDRGLRETTGKL